MLCRLRLERTGRFSLGQDSELYAPTSSGLSQFLLDTYDAAVVDDTSAGSTVEGTRSRPPRYGAFVFGDLIPLNVTVDWDAVRERPELVAMVLETIADSLPTEGGEFDLKVGDVVIASHHNHLLDS